MPLFLINFNTILRAYLVAEAAGGALSFINKNSRMIPGFIKSL